MNEKPILFSGPMVIAILDGSKTQTRRIVKAPKGHHPAFAGVDFPGPYAVGMTLWVRESGYMPPDVTGRDMREGADTWPEYVYSADNPPDVDQLKEWGWKSRPSIYMPRWASRITLEVTAVRAERVQDISEQDAIAEGIVKQAHGYGVREAFACLWDSINAKRGYSWARNPWVWAVTFKRVTP